ncbi:MAG TPA: SMC family ATPase [Armatimonadota bacterium]|nr:SMC family ATPase [Armatimonadota bacterium]
MIPVRLFLRNFMSYGEPGEELDFGFHTACLCGDNGNGKSALLDAMTWALWGRAPRLEGARSKDEEIIRRADGVNEALVEFQFAADGERYRVLRRLRRDRGQTLELYLADGESWRPLTGATKTDTEGVIQSLLGLDYHTFVMSSFLFQGKADSFTRARPGERKDVLGRILRLDLYDELAKRARDAGRECEGRSRQLGDEIARLQAQAEREQELEGKARETEAALGDSEQELARCESALEQARACQAAADGAVAELRRADTALKQAAAQVESLSRQHQDFARRVAAHRAALAQEQEARAAVARLEQVRRRDEDLSARRERAAAVEMARHQAAAAIRAEQARLETQLAAVEASAEESRATAGQAEALARQAQEIEGEIRACREAEAALASCREEAQRLRAAAAADEQTGKSLRAELDEAAARMEALAKASARCPLCEQELGEELRRRLLEQARALSHREESSLAELKRARDETAGLLERMEAKMRALQPYIARAGELQKRLGQVQRQREEARAAAVRADNSATRAADLRRTLEAGAFAPDDRRRLAEAEAALAEIAYDAAAHKQAQEAIRGLAGWEKKLGALESAREALPGDEAHLAQVEESLAQARRQLICAQAERADLAQRAADAKPAAAACAQAQARLSAAAKERDRRVGELAGLRAQIAACGAARREAQARRRERATADSDRVLYSELAEAFGRQGVQALVVETVLPQLTEDANELLERMTEGRMQVTFVTQRERPDGDAAETLDLHISDELGTRRYELYSGGEAFRVDFAVRVALARLLAHRAGARLQTLVIDEGFGTQDAQARDRLVECINAIQGDFEKVLVITHIDDLKDAFQDRIEVTKDETGSHLRRSAGESAGAG